MIERYGPWRAYNIRIAEGVFTMEPGLIGAAERSLQQIVQVVSDVAPRPLSELRILDLASLEGAYGLELARRGAEVLAMEGRPEPIAKAAFVKDALGLDRYTVIQDDVRNLSVERHGTFDVVLCLGILYHLDPPDVFAFARRVGEVCTGFTVVGTQVGLSDEVRVSYEGHEYAGTTYREREGMAWSSIGNQTSFWPTRASLLNLLADCGFTSVLECLSPPVPEVARFVDHVVLVASKGAPVRLESAPQVADLPEAERRWPERLERAAHPSQRRSRSMRDRVSFSRRGFTDTFRKRGSR